MAEQTQYIRVINHTGQTIVHGAVTHATESYGVQTVSLNSLDNGQETAILPVTTGPSSRDYWYVWWTNDGTNYVAWAGRSAIHGHESQGSPGTVSLEGRIGYELAVSFTVDNDRTDNETIPNPW